MRFLQTATIVTFLLLAVGCMRDPKPLVGAAISPAAASSACAEIGIKPPNNAKFSLLHREQGIDAAIWMKMSAPSGDTAQFLASKPLNQAVWSSSSNYIQGNASWPEWNPSRAQNFRKAQIALPNAKYLNVLLDEDDPAVTHIYLMWHET